MTAVQKGSTFGGYRPRRKHRYTKGTKVYCWRFLHPIAGWCGGDDLDDWSDKRPEIESRLQYCEWPSELIEAVA